MRTRTSWLALVVAAGLALVPAMAWGQDYTPPDPVFPFPLYHDRPESGGLFVASEFLFMQQSNLLHHQIIARRGLIDFDGSITAALNGQVIEPSTGPAFILPAQIRPGNFIGSGTPALFADDAKGPSTYEPGFNITVGWRFENGVVFDVEWWHLFEAKYAAGATLVPPTFAPGNNLEETFLTAFVFAFPNDYAGPQFKLAIGNPNAAFGIWNGASVMTIEFIQRFEQWDTTGRIPIYQSDNCRCYGLLGTRLVWMWERFKWRTVAEDFLGNAAGDDSAIYTNVVSQRMYGAHIGCGSEWRLGDTPIGTFSFSFDAQVAPLINVVKERATYERGDFETASKRAKTEYTFVPEAQCQPSIWWYPIEGIQLHFGYDFMGFFNTVASPAPVSFNYSNIDPAWERGHFRYLQGFDAGIGFIF
jgi:hypothetical protein